MKSLFAQVVFPLPMNRAFTYAIPPDLAETVHRGSRVLAPFGRQTLEGVVVETTSETDVAESRVRPLLDCFDDEPFFSEELLDLCRWVGETYLSSWGEALDAATPAGVRVVAHRRVFLTEMATPDAVSALRTRSPMQAAILDALASRDGETVDRLRLAVGGASPYHALARLAATGFVRIEEELREGASPKTVLVAELVPSPEEASRLLAELREKAPKQASALETLCRRNDAMPVAELVRETDATYGVIRALEAKGLLRVHDVEESRSAFSDEVEALALSAEPLPLNRDQKSAVDAILDAFETGRGGVFVLRGVTGSGKTEVYLHAIRRVLDAGRSAILLVPEIALTPQTVSRLVARFGLRVAVLHSRLSAGERYDEWRRVRSGDADIVVGPRSAIFAPVRRLGIAILDEEHEGSYKQDDPAPRYHAREVATYRAARNGAPLVLGSATPSLESHYRTITGEYRLLGMPSRVGDIALPPVHVCDMREELKRGNRTIFAERLRVAVADRLRRGEQTMLYLNRRGFSTYVFCRDCGYVEQCPICHISLTHHEQTRILVCHHCGYVRPMPAKCPQCAGKRIKYLGLGTQQVEEETRKAFPKARIARMDADTTATKGAHERILDAFRRGEQDILIGTQMIAKGLDFPRVTLVGVLLAETSLNLPDFRAGERTFNLLTQVAGRSGRSTLGGEVVFQTYTPEHFSIVAAQRHDYEAFCEQELKVREQYGYPPYTRALRVLLRSEDERAVIEASQSLGNTMTTLAKEERFGGIVVKGPAQAPFARIRGQNRWHILLCASSAEALREFVSRTLEDSPPTVTKGVVAVTIDVDPLTVL
jgi:primosomal protein N' (replication factor Y)